MLGGALQGGKSNCLVALGSENCNSGQTQVTVSFKILNIPIAGQKWTVKNIQHVLIQGGSIFN